MRETDMSGNDTAGTSGGEHAPNGRLWLTVVLCALGFSFDLMEIALGGVLGAVMSGPPHQLGSTELALLLASVYVGAIVGAPLLGWIADRRARRRVLAFALLLLGLSSICAGLARDWLGVALWRTVSGLALGAYPPMVIAYLTDILPERRRGMLIMLVAAAAGLGPIGIVFAVRSLGPAEPLGLEGWRWAMIVAAAGAIVVGVLLMALSGPANQPSPPIPAAATGRSIRTWIAPLALLAPLNFLSPWSTVAFPLLIGVVLSARGFALPDALLFVGLSTMGPFLGGILASLIMDRVSRPIILTGALAVMLVALAGFVIADNHLVLGISVLAFNVVGAIYVPALSIYGAQLVPGDRRAAVTGAAWSLNRLSAVLAPLLLVPALALIGPADLGAIIAASLLAGFGILLAALRGTA